MNAPVQLIDLNRFAKRASFSAVVKVAIRCGLSAVGGRSSSVLTDLLDGVYTLRGLGFDPERQYVALAAYPDLDDEYPTFTYRNPYHPTSIRIIDGRRVRGGEPFDSPFGTWRVVWSSTIEATAIAYPLTPATGDHACNRRLSPDSDLLLINPKDGLLPTSLTADERRMVAIGCSMYDWTYAQKNIADLRHVDMAAIEREFFGGRRVGWRMAFDRPIDDAPDGDDRLSRLIRGEPVGDYPPTPDEVMLVVAMTGRMPRIALAAFHSGE